MAKYPDIDYLNYDPFEGDRDVDVRLRSVKIVTVRKERTCHMSRAPLKKESHAIQPGERARYEKALVEGEWGSYYVCLNCMDEWFDEIFGNNAQ